MIRISDLKYILEIEFSVKNFAWSIFGTLLLNLSVIVTGIFVGLTNGKDIYDILGVLPYGFLVVTLASFLIFPFLDLKEYVLDRVMCRELCWDYELNFIKKFDANNQERVREVYQEAIERNHSKSKIKDDLNNLKLEIKT